jgi:hypothetical protein
MSASETGSGRNDEQARRDLTDDLRATLGARRELGDDYDRVLADSFVERVDALVSRRVSDELAHRQRWQTNPVRHPSDPARRRESRYPTGLAYASLALGIPISGAAGGTGGVGGLAAAWVGIAVVNVATAWGHRRAGPVQDADYP